MKVLCRFLPPKEGSLITLKFIECDHQKNANDCGVYAIANMVALLHGIDPCIVTYPPGLLRTHLKLCMEKRSFEMFPNCVDETDDMNTRVVTTNVEELFCSCKMPEDSNLYFSCTVCKKWFHPPCQALGHMNEEQIAKAKNLKCIQCQARNVKSSKRRINTEAGAFVVLTSRRSWLVLSS